MIRLSIGNFCTKNTRDVNSASRGTEKRPVFGIPTTQTTRQVLILSSRRLKRVRVDTRAWQNPVFGLTENVRFGACDPTGEGVRRVGSLALAENSLFSHGMTEIERVECATSRVGGPCVCVEWCAHHRVRTASSVGRAH